MKKPLGYIVHQWEQTSEHSGSGTPRKSFSLRHALQLGREWMERGPMLYFSITPVWGPMA